MNYRNEWRKKAMSTPTVIEADDAAYTAAFDAKYGEGEYKRLVATLKEMNDKLPDYLKK